MNIRLIAGLLVALLVTMSAANAGVVVTKDGKVSVGPMKVSKKNKILMVKLEYGILRYKLEKVLWYTTDKRVNDRLAAGKLAYRKDKEERVALILLKSCIEKEPDNREEAEAEIKRIHEIKKKKKDEADDALL
jgi:hypothetical protein